MMSRAVMRQISQDKLWNLQEAQLSHTPMSEEGANKLSDAFRQIRNSLQRQFKYATGQITISEYLQNPDSDMEDGVMRFIED